LIATHDGGPNAQFLDLDFSTSGRRFAVQDAKKRLEVFAGDGKAIASNAVEDLATLEMADDGNIVGYLDLGRRLLLLREPDRARILVEHPCPDCRELHLSSDGSRVVVMALDGPEVWDLRADRQLFKTSAGAGLFQAAADIARDGRSFAWSQGATTKVRD